MDRVSCLEGDDAFPAPGVERGPGFNGCEIVVLELDRTGFQDIERSRQEDVSKRQRVFHTGMRFVGCLIDFFAQFAAVEREFFGQMENRHHLAQIVAQRDFGADLKRVCLLARRIQQNGDGPGDAGTQLHGVKDTASLGLSHEARERAEQALCNSVDVERGIGVYRYTREGFGFFTGRGERVPRE